MIPFEEALEQCIEAIHAGASVADCLARYPAYADRLAPLLIVAAELYAVPLEVMSDAGFERQRLRLREQILARQAKAAGKGVVRPAVMGNGVVEHGRVNGKPTSHPPVTSQPPARRWGWPAWATFATHRAGLVAAVMLVAIITALGGVTLVSAKAAPTEPLYTVRLFVESVVDALPAPPETQASRALARAEEQLTAGLAVCKADPILAESLWQQVAQQRERAMGLLERVSGAEAATLRQRVAALNERMVQVERECAQSQSVAPPPTTQQSAPAPQPPVAAPALATDTLTPQPTIAATLTPRPTASATVAAASPTATVGAPSGGASGPAHTNTSSSAAAPAPQTPTASRTAAAAAPANTPVPPIQAPPTQAAPANTPVPPTQAPPTQAAPANTSIPPTQAPPTQAPTAAPPPTAIPLPTSLIEPTGTPVPTNEPRPTEPPPPTQPPPTQPPPPTPTYRVLEQPTKLPTDPPPPTSRPVEATKTPNIPPGRATPRP